MARINIEDSLWRDERFHKLSAAIGKIQALGLVVIAFDLAQKWWSKNPDHVIPVFEWSKTPELKHLVEHGLARVKDSGIWVCGAEEGCAFIKKQQENGKKGALKRLENLDGQISQTSQAGPLPLPLPLPLKEIPPIVPQGDEPVPRTGKAKKTKSTGRKKTTHTSANKITLEHPLVVTWNKLTAGVFPPVEILNEVRKRRLGEIANQFSIEDWTGAIEWLKASDFHSGRKPSSTGTTFKLTIDTVIRSSNIVKYIENGRQNKAKNKSKFFEDFVPEFSTYNET